MSEKITSAHLERSALLYVRQSTPHQVAVHQESRRLQYAMQDRLRVLGWSEIAIVDDDLGKSASSGVAREGFQRIMSQVCLGGVGVVAARDATRLARSNREWSQLVEICAVVDTLLVDHESVYDARNGNDRLLLGLKGNLSAYELDTLRQRAHAARRAKALRGELVMTPPVGFIKTAEGCLEKAPDLRLEHTIPLVFRKTLALGSGPEPHRSVSGRGDHRGCVRGDESRRGRHPLAGRRAHRASRRSPTTGRAWLHDIDGHRRCH
jgi:DNA invertase Pin-like site-specific DNA recombinase